MKIDAQEWVREAANEAAHELGRTFDAPDHAARCAAIADAIDVATAMFRERGVAPYPFVAEATKFLAAADDFGLRFTRRPKNGTWVSVTGSRRGGYIDGEVEYLAEPTAAFREHQRLATHRYGRRLRDDGLVEAVPVAQGGHVEPESPDRRRAGGFVVSRWSDMYLPLYVTNEPLEESIERLGLQAQVEAGRQREREARERTERREAQRARNERRRAYEDAIIGIAAGMRPSEMTKRQRGAAEDALGGMGRVVTLAEKAMDEGLDAVRAEVERATAPRQSSPTMPRSKKGKTIKMVKRPPLLKTSKRKQNGSGSSALADALRAAMAK